MAAARGKTGARGAKGEEFIPYAVARQANRAIFYRYLAILAILTLGALAAFVSDSNRISSTEDPCSEALHGSVCMVRTCERLQDVGYGLSPDCQAILNKVRHGKIGEGPGSARLHTSSSQGGGGPGNGGGSTPGGGQGGAPSGTTSTPPAKSPPVNVGVPGVPSVCIGGVGGVNC